MLPISAENADPERPLTAIAVSSGPNSRVKANGHQIDHKLHRPEAAEF
jgi:hypothetical protein